MNLFNMKPNQILNMDSDDLMYASEEPEFYYIINDKDTDIAVPEGEPVGIDVQTNKGVELQLFSNIYWSPSEL